MMVSFAEPVYPLEKAEFVRALATGHGRALIHIERHGAECFRDEILDAALFTKVYDTQCNGYGEEWLARLCAKAGLVDAIISGSHGIEGGDGALRCRLLKEFAFQGHAAARPVLRDMCRFDERWNNLLGCEEIVELDGEVGFVFVADRLGERLLEDEEFWVSSWLISLLDRKCGDGSAMAILERESAANPRIAAYRDAVLKWQTREDGRQEQTRPGVEGVIELILTSDKRRPQLRSYGEKASIEERLKVAALGFAKMEPMSLENYLIYFQRTGFPEFREEYLTILQHADEKIRWRASRVLSNHADPAVRRAAYEVLAQGDADSFVQILRSSGLREDTESLLDAISVSEILEDADKCHDVGVSLLDLMETNQAMDHVRLPLWLYEHGPCMCCRYVVVKHMVGRSILPECVADECLADAYKDIRKLVDTPEGG